MQWKTVTGQGTVEQDEDGKLNEQGQAPRSRVDLVLLIEGHHLSVQRFLVVLVLLLQDLHHRLKLLHSLHGIELETRTSQVPYRETIRKTKPEPTNGIPKWDEVGLKTTYP